MFMPIILILLFILGTCLYKLYGYYLKNDLFEKISFILESKFHYNLTLKDYILTFQEKIQLTENYIIAPEDIETINKILEVYKNNLSHKFHTKKLTLTHKLSMLDDKEYFCLSLYNFLLKNKLSDHISFSSDKIRMYAVLEIEYHSQMAYNRIYQLTDFAIVYYKLLLICNMYCLQNNKIKKTGIILNQIKDFKEAIDTRKIEVIMR